MTLEDLQSNVAVRGILPNALARVIEQMARTLDIHAWNRQEQCPVAAGMDKLLGEISKTLDTHAWTTQERWLAQRRTPGI